MAPPESLPARLADAAASKGGTGLASMGRAAIASPLASIAGQVPSATLLAAASALPQLPADLAVAVGTLEAAVTRAERVASSGISQLTPAEVVRLRDAVHDASQRELAVARDMHDFTAQGRRADVVALRDGQADLVRTLLSDADVRLAQKVDVTAFARAAAIVTDAAAAVEPLLVSSGQLQTAMPTACVRPGPLFCDDQNLVEVWGTENDTYETDSVARVRIDLGGNDVYQDHTGTAVGDLANCDINAPGPGCVTGLAVKANIDVAGDDQYTTDIGQGVGLLGVGVLVDGGGHDTYTAMLGQGLGLIGGGAVVDEGVADDTYGLLALGQGFALVGAGVLSDGGGNDSYASLVGGQGAALVGAGVLVDRAGNDTYNCFAICQGATLLGAGLLADGGGNDVYGGLGLFGLALPGFISQGAALLAGAGALVDLAGNDDYQLWDIGHGYALSAGLATGTTQMQQTDTVGALYDGAGTDHYLSLGSNTYGFAVGYSAARFYDHGGATDTYDTANKNPANAHTWVESDGTHVWLANYDTGQANGTGQDD